MRPQSFIALVALALLATMAATAQAATLQPIGDFDQPIYVTSDPGNPNRLFVVERTGKIEQVSGGSITLFADLSSMTQCAATCNGERGMYSMALAPDFDTSGRFYVDYANSVDGTAHVAELTAAGSTASAATQREVLTIPRPEKVTTGGQLQFGAGGYLYVSVGDDEVSSQAQNLASPLGKILRINPLPSGALPYTIPPGNPFAASPAPTNAIWSYGLRNPFHFSFDRVGGGLVIADVGQNRQEEVDYAPAPLLGAGANYGWDCREGVLPGPAAAEPECASPPAGGFVDPVFAYPHKDPGGGGAYGCAIIGGYVVRDPGLPGLYGRYLYADHCIGELRSFDLSSPLATDRSEGITIGEIDSFGEDSCGRLYTVGNTQVSRLVGSAPNACATVELARSYLGIKAQGRRVKRSGRALLTAFVSPCKGRKGEPVKLYRGRAHIATRRLDRACSVRFRPRIRQRWTFRATIAEDATYVAASSRRLKIAIKRHIRHGAHKRAG